LVSCTCMAASASVRCRWLLVGLPELDHGLGELLRSVFTRRRTATRAHAGRLPTLTLADVAGEGPPATRSRSQIRSLTTVCNCGISKLAVQESIYPKELQQNA